MKVSKPPSGSLSGPPVGPHEVKRAGAKGFADKLARVAASGKAHATPATRPAALAHAGRVPGMAEIGNALKTGKITPEAAVERVVKRIVASQAGPHAPAAIKEHLSAALRQTLEDDPMLAAKIRALSEE